MSDLKDTKILVVDDNELNLKVAVKMLKKYNFNNIDQVHSGAECLELIKTNKYDLIILDDMMPNMSGTETMIEMKKDSEFKTPVVVLTANALAGMREEYIKKGFDEYLAKPIDKEEFIRVLNKLLSTSITSEQDNIDKEPEIEVLEETPSSTIDFKEPPEIDNETFLRNSGVDMDKSLELLGDMEMYNMTFNDFANELESKWSKIEQEKLSSDTENYSIDVHSLKSDCKYLGFYDLADIAYEHELKSKENDIDFINKNFDRLELEYEKVLHIVKEYKEKLSKQTL